MAFQITSSGTSIQKKNPATCNTVIATNSLKTQLFASNFLTIRLASSSHTSDKPEKSNKSQQSPFKNLYLQNLTRCCSRLSLSLHVRTLRLTYSCTRLLSIGGISIKRTLDSPSGNVLRRRRLIWRPKAQDWCQIYSCTLDFLFFGSKFVAWLQYIGECSGVLGMRALIWTGALCALFTVNFTI